MHVKCYHEAEFNSILYSHCSSVPDLTYISFSLALCSAETPMPITPVVQTCGDTTNVKRISIF